MNILLQKFDTAFDTAPFKHIKIKDFMPSIETSIEEAKNEIDVIKTNANFPDFENTIEALEQSGKRLNRISSILFNLNSAETSPELQEVTRLASPLLAAFGNDIQLDPVLFKKIKEVYLNKTDLKLSTEQSTLLEKTYKSFVRNGANLSEEEKQKLRLIDQDLSLLSLQFGENILAETNEFELEVNQEDDLKGMPPSVLEMAKSLAIEKGKENSWVFTLQYPSYVPFVTYCPNRLLRKEMTEAFARRGFRNNAFDNQEIVKKIAKLRLDRANLLGYATHADFILEERMASSADKVLAFLEDLKFYALPKAQNEISTLKQFAQESGGLDEIQRWDFAYYSEKLKDQLYQINDELLKPYFKLENVVNGVFEVAYRLYGLKFKMNESIQLYHPEVKAYEVVDKEGNLKAIFYTDFFPRAGKRDGAWMTSFKGQSIQNNVQERPHISIVCNFSPPTKELPSLLTFQEVTTLFHEFGHALHGIMANTQYESLSGTNVYWDFVELPSQIMENWAYEPECLKIFARHYLTNELIPLEYIEKIKQSANFMTGYQTLRQISFSLLDLHWHHIQKSEVKSIEEFEQEILKDTQVLPFIPQSSVSCSFSHIFQGGYSAGYYSYKWAEVLDADAFSVFQENGIFDEKTAQDFANFILSKGGSEHPMDLYLRFRKKEPSTKALLERSELI